MTENNFSEIHQNSFQTDTLSVAGPASSSSDVDSRVLGPIPFGIAGTIAFNRRGQIITIRSTPKPTLHEFEIGNTLLLIDQDSLEALAREELPARPTSSSGVTFAGGGYFYVDNEDRVVCITSNQQLRIY